MALLIRFAIREIREAIKNNDSNNPRHNRQNNDTNQYGDRYAQGYAQGHSQDYDQGYRPSRRERKRQRSQALRDMTSSPSSSSSFTPRRALGTNLASPSFNRGYSSSSYDSSQSYIYDNEPRGYSVSGGPTYEYAKMGIMVYKLKDFATLILRLDGTMSRRRGIRLGS